jgi:ribosomal protein S18 acetylase RimI-like enzyme
MLLLSTINHRVLAVAHQIHGVQMAAYRQEAELLGVGHFPPLERAVGDVLTSTEEFLGAFVDKTLAGVLSLGVDDEGRGISIASLVVRPDYQRRGVGQALVKAATERQRASELTVQTAAGNAPALALYARFSFKEYRRWFAGGDRLALVKLSRSSALAQGAA